MDAVTPMSLATDAPADVTSALSGEGWSIDHFMQLITEEASPGQPFSPQSIAFCEALSRDLLDPLRRAALSAGDLARLLVAAGFHPARPGLVHPPAG